MADAPLDFEYAGQLPVKINGIEVVTIENVSIRRQRTLTPRGGMRGKITVIAKGVPTVNFSFKMPLLKTKALTEENFSKFQKATSRPFTLEVTNGVGSITLAKCEIGGDEVAAQAMQADGTRSIEGQAQEWLDT